jgi:hypothetical protein
MKPEKNVTGVFRKIYTLSIIQSLVESNLKFTVESANGGDFVAITVYGYTTTIEAFPLYHHQIAYALK